MKITREGTDLIISDNPGCIWLLGAFFIGVGSVFVFGGSGGYVYLEQHPRWVALVHVFLGAGAVVCGLWQIVQHPMRRLVISRTAETIALRERGFFNGGRRTFRFAETERFRLETEKDSDGDDCFWLVLELRNGERLRVSSYAGHDEAVQRSVMFEANQFIYRQMPTHADENRRQIM